VLLALTLRRLAIRGAIFAALVFALHPLHVESVAWISEQKNTLSTVFYLGAALMYLRFDAHRKLGTYIFAFSLFVLGLLTKTTTATLPAALLVVFWWQRGSLSWQRDVQPLVPWFLVGVGAGLFTAWVERTVVGADGVGFDLAFVDRCVLAGRALWFYGGKLLWPVNLTFIYPRWVIDAGSLPQWLPLAGAIALLVVCWRHRLRSRVPLATALLFGGTLFPALGFFNVYPFQYSFVADHFAYLGSIPMIAAATAGVSFTGGNRRHGPLVAALLLLTSLGLMTWKQAHVYRDNQSLFRSTIARNPGCWMAYNNLGKELMRSKEELPEAIVHLGRAIALRPDYAEAHNNLGLALSQSGRSNEAIPHLRTSLRLKPALFQTHNNLGIALASSGRPDEALKAFEQAAQLNPSMPNIHENWARALLLLGRKSEAEERFAHAARLRGGRRGESVNQP
jgi:Flp pilus assembly protein TadD